MKTNKMNQWTKLILAILLLAVVCITAATADGAGVSFPDLTQTDCVWDGKGCLISETVHDLNGNPALNSRGFHQAEYTWDENGNKLSEAYFGLNGESAVNTDLGYARSEFTYLPIGEEEYRIVTEDRYDASGNRADIPGTYSYRRDTWEDGKRLVSTEYFNAQGQLTRPTGGYAQILYYHEEGEETYTITKFYLDADGSPLIGSEGGAIVKYVYTTKEYLIHGTRIEYNALDMMLPEEEQMNETERDSLLLSEEIEKRGIRDKICRRKQNPGFRQMAQTNQ